MVEDNAVTTAFVRPTITESFTWHWHPCYIRGLPCPRSERFQTSIKTSTAIHRSFEQIIITSSNMQMKSQSERQSNNWQEWMKQHCIPNSKGRWLLGWLKLLLYNIQNNHYNSLQVRWTDSTSMSESIVMDKHPCAIIKLVLAAEFDLLLCVTAPHKCNPESFLSFSSSLKDMFEWRWHAKAGQV